MYRVSFRIDRRDACPTGLGIERGLTYIKDEIASVVSLRCNDI